MENQEMEKLLEQVKAKAWVDSGFRRVLIAEPKKAIEALIGGELPENVKINILEEQPGAINLVLPAKIEEEELSDDQLDSVAGGFCKWPSCKVTCVDVDPRCFEFSCKG